jgi:hypothetical protein
VYVELLYTDTPAPVMLLCWPLSFSDASTTSPAVMWATESGLQDVSIKEFGSTHRLVKNPAEPWRIAHLIHVWVTYFVLFF